MKKLILGILLTTFGAFVSHAQLGKGLTLSLDTQQILIGDQIQMTLQIQSSTSDKVSFPEIGDTLISEIEVVRRETPDTLVQGDRQLISQNIVLTSWDTGVYTVPPLVGFINGDSAYGPSFMVGVYMFPIDSTNAIMDIKGNLEDPLTVWDYVEVYGPYVVVYWLILIAIFLIWMYFKRKKKEVVFVEPEVRIPAHVMAFERLRQLEEKELWQKGKHKEYHVRLSEILREYLENRYGILALEQTSEEILGDLRPMGMAENLHLQLKELFLLMDMVKFAKQVPIANENEGALKACRSIIEQTKKVELVEPKES